MSVVFKVTKCRNPKFPDDNFFKGTVQKTGVFDFEKLAKRINDSTTVTQSDCFAVLKSMKQHIIEALLEGQVVVLDDLGRFQISIQGKSYPQDVLTEKEFKPAEMVKGWKIVFRPDPKLKKDVAKDFSLKRISSEWMA